MPYKYIGRTTSFKGKTLWEIVGNLKNFGVGRVVARSIHDRYPEPSYMKILKVETLPNPETVTIDDVRKVKVWVERVFRGKVFKEISLIESASYKTDYKLIPKDEEAAFCKPAEKITNSKIVPRYMEFPPILKELMIRETIMKGEKEEPKLEVLYNTSTKYFKYKIAEEGEKPDFEISLDIGVPKSPNLYKGIKL